MDFFTYFSDYNRYRNIIGIGVIFLMAYAASRDRKSINARTVGIGFLMHILIAIAVLRTSIGVKILGSIAGGIEQLYRAADLGAQFLFGNLANPSGAWGFVFALKVLPIIIFFGALMSLLYHWGLVQRFVEIVARGVRPLLRTTGSETLCAIANSFLGQTEAPLLIRRYLPHLSESEMFVVMVSGMGTISGSILAVYASMGIPAAHLLAASVMAIPATIVLAKIMVPADHEGKAAIVHADEVGQTSNALDAIAQGTFDGLQLALNVAAMLIAFIALIGLVNACLGTICSVIASVMHVNVPCLSLQSIFGVLCSPFGWLLGFDGDVMIKAGELIGLKVAVNEMVAYSVLLGAQLPDRAVMLLTYALCGFSNFSCIGIQLGGIGALAPSQRQVLSALGLRAVFAATLANILSALVAGLVL